MSAEDGSYVNKLLAPRCYVAAYPPSAQAHAAASLANASAGVDVPQPASGARFLDRARLGPEPSVVGKLDALKGASVSAVR
ncbi:hypothetical protein RR48_05428 [Papilio machaon]|uniref:Uncharacterized protein n=1 Tax=Papilio machaon TaxID=76193 RepID=A0A0N1I8Y2_PAPMA|nr:hypothetical protein RR48_05428 [Papilio machaon]